MNQRNKSVLFAGALCGVLLLCGFDQAQAQTESLGISPAIVEASVKRGATYNKEFFIANNTTTRLRVRFSVTDYWYGEHNERVEGRPGTLPRSASLWVQFTPSETIIEPHASRKVNAVISVPREAAGGYYTMPVVEAEAADTPTGGVGTTGAINASIAVRFRGLMLLTTEDAATYNVEVMSGAVTPPNSFAPLEVALDIRNRSTAHINARGVFAILNESGKLMGRGRLDEKRYLPAQRDTLKTAWAGELGTGHYTMLVTLSYDRAGMEATTLVYDISFDVK